MPLYRDDEMVVSKGHYSLSGCLEIEKEWIEGRDPPEEGYYLVTHEYGDAQIDYYFGREEDVGDRWIGSHDYEIVAYRKIMLPQPYKIDMEKAKEVENICTKEQ